jgi:transcriptional regulator with XRE-family HTH domain
MQHRGLTQAELARRAGISPQLVNHLVRGVRPSTSPASAAAIVRALDIPRDLLFEEKISRVTRDIERPAA